MALKIILKPNEQMILGGALVRNGNSSSVLFIENTVPLLRGKSILTEKEADTPCKKIYFLIQLMYLDNPNSKNHYPVYWELVHSVVKAAPSTVLLLDRINEFVFQAKYYDALKACFELIAYEKELMQNAE